MDQSLDGAARKIKDGIVDAEEFESQKLKILWILREPNGEVLDFMKYLKNPTVYKKWQASYGLVVKLSYALINEIRDFKLVPDASKIVHDTMSKIAIMNIKKTAGKAQISPKKMLSYALANKDDIESQIVEISPDVIIFGGTKSYLSQDTMLSIKKRLNKPVRIISTYHPNQRAITHKEYINNALNLFYK